MRWRRRSPRRGRAGVSATTAPLRVAQVVGQDLVEDDRPQMQLAFGDGLGEELRLAQRHGLQGGDHDERRPPVGQQALDGPGPLDESVVHALEQDEELGDVGRGTASPGCGRPPGRRASRPSSPAVNGRERSATAAGGSRRTRPCARERRGSRARCGWGACPPRSGRTCPRSGSRTGAPWRCSRGSGRSGRRCCGTGGWTGSRRACGRRGHACRIRESHDSLVSSIAAQSSPRGVTPAEAKVSSGTRRSVLPMPSRPSASASRRAGSTVSTSTFPPPWAAAMAAAAAAVVVLPTPPGPQATTISLRGQQAVERPPARRERPVRVGASSEPQLLAERTRPPGGWYAGRGTG